MADDSGELCLGVLVQCVVPFAYALEMMHQSRF